MGIKVGEISAEIFDIIDEIEYEEILFAENEYIKDVWGNVND